MKFNLIKTHREIDVKSNLSSNILGSQILAQRLRFFLLKNGLIRTSIICDIISQSAGLRLEISEDYGVPKWVKTISYHLGIWDYYQLQI